MSTIIDNDLSGVGDILYDWSVTVPGDGDRGASEAAISEQTRRQWKPNNEGKRCFLMIGFAKQVWEALKILDAADVDKPGASSEVVEIYSLRVVSKLLAGKPEGWNREHLWPRSYGLMSGPSLTDLHNIRPADVNVNSSRGNKFYGECHVSSSNCRKPATRESAFDTEADKERWAPPRQVRGDIARAIMYMAVCYGVNQSGRGLNLHLSDSPNIANKEMGMLSTLLKWNEIDPPSREEKLRNERICIKYQHNRNPFVDHPEYANRIWKHVVPRR
ncbi:hypothetical protein RHSIM_Rhsim01G0002700 [Rhododendron simsii]|uniref:Uncharacterized protein n=1 Tax=Rhododendron simsii TaxID=118357 RepID=A0A834M1L7_RHOSS|nr:hypothetical protein RHSIM_Rhsim01G0002700 [Rhododendron simsii]